MPTYTQKHAKVPSRSLVIQSPYPPGYPYYTPTTWHDYGFTQATQPVTSARVRPVGQWNLLKAATSRTWSRQSRTDANWYYAHSKGWTLGSVCYTYGQGNGGESSKVNGSRASMLNARLISQVKGNATNLANMLGEYRQTAGLVATNLGRVANLAMAVAKRDPRILHWDRFGSLQSGKFQWRKPQNMSRRQWDRLHDLHLEFMYGVKPLMNDVFSIKEDLRRKIAVSDIILSVRARDTAHYSNAYWDAYGSVGGRKTYVEVVVVNQQRQKGLVKLKNDVLLNTLGAYGFTNPASVVWELTPFSFVWDWWFNIGEVIASLDTCLYMQEGIYVHGSMNHYTRMVDVYGAQSYYVQHSKARGTAAGLPMLASLRYKPSISVTHVLNGISLLQQQSRRFR